MNRETLQHHKIEKKRDKDKSWKLQRKLQWTKASGKYPSMNTGFKIPNGKARKIKIPR